MISPSLIAAIGVFRMLQVPQGASARNRRNGRKVIRSRRRTDGPFQCPRVPRIVTGSGSLEIRNYEVCQKNNNRKCLNERADGYDEVQSIPTAPWLVGVDLDGASRALPERALRRTSGESQSGIARNAI